MEDTSNILGLGRQAASDAPAPSDSFLNAYISTTRQAAEQSLKSLDASINWALSATLGILAFVTNAVVKSELADAERGLLLAILGIGLALLVHFGIRAAKNYLNIVRFAKLERETLKYLLKIEDISAQTMIKTISRYHIAWRSPLSSWTILRKVLFEFGFLYLAGFTGFMFWFVQRALSAQHAWIPRLVLAATALSVSAELLLFKRSPYVRNPEPDEDARTKA